MARPEKTRRIYADTPVIGGCFDEEFRIRYVWLFDRIREGRALLVLSDLTLAEVALAPAKVRSVLENLRGDSVELVLQDAESQALSEEYIRLGVLSPRMIADAQHIAVATVAKVDVLVSWNSRHIVNLDRIRQFNAVNLRLGYPLLEIRSPLELWPDDGEV